MKTIRAPMFIATILIGLCLVGCSTPLTAAWGVHTNGVVADMSAPAGDPHAYIYSTTIYVPTLTKEQRQDVWISTGTIKQMPLADITEEDIRRIGTLSDLHDTGQGWEGSPKKYNNTYYVSGTSFRFEEGQLITIIDGGWYDRRTDHPAVFGSKKNGSIVSLPFSLASFDKVFGKVDSIAQERGF